MKYPPRFLVDRDVGSVGRCDERGFPFSTNWEEKSHGKLVPDGGVCGTIVGNWIFIEKKCFFFFLRNTYSVLREQDCNCFRSRLELEVFLTGIFHMGYV